MIKERKNKSIFKTYFIYFVCLIVFVFVRIGYNDSWLFQGLAGNKLDIAATLLIQVFIMFLLPLTLYCLLIKVTPKQVFKTSNYYKINFNVLLISLAIGVLAFVINIVISTMFSGIISIIGYRQPTYFGTSEPYTNTTFYVQILTIAILPSLCEEFLHRGLLLQGTKHIGFKRSIVLSGVLFGLIHFNINQVFFAIILGMLLGLVAVVSKNIWPAVIIHFVNNMIGVYLEFAAHNGYWGKNFYTKINDYFLGHRFFSAFLFIFVLLIIITAILSLLIYLLYRHSILKNVEYAINKAYSKIENYKKNAPIKLNENEEVRYLLETTTTLSLNVEEMKSPIDIVLPKQTSVYKSTFKDNIFLVSAIVLGAVVTLFTFIWGLF